MKARTANMNPYEAERERIIYEFKSGRSRYTKSELDEILSEIRERETEERYNIYHLVYGNVDIDQ